MHRDNMKALLPFDAEAAKELPDYDQFDELRTQIQDNDDMSFWDQDDLEEFLHEGGADTMADNITSAFARTPEEQEVLAWSMKEIFEIIRLKYLPSYDAFNQRTTMLEVEDLIEAVNNDLYEQAVHISQLVMYLPEHMEHLKKHPVRRLPPFEWKPK